MFFFLVIHYCIVWSMCLSCGKWNTRFVVHGDKKKENPGENYFDPCCYFYIMRCYINRVYPASQIRETVVKNNRNPFLLNFPHCLWDKTPVQYNVIQCNGPQMLTWNPNTCNTFKIISSMKLANIALQLHQTVSDIMFFVHTAILKKVGNDVYVIFTIWFPIMAGVVP